jgi:hypothetical protein
MGMLRTIVVGKVPTATPTMAGMLLPECVVNADGEVMRANDGSLLEDWEPSAAIQ